MEANLSVTVELVCTDQGQHRPYVVHRYIGPVPMPSAYLRNEHGYERDLTCRRCRRAPRPGSKRLRQLLEVAATMPNRCLDVSMRAM
jgi:hypothetical protein